MYLAIYDVIGIQKYIFQSSKLKENIGASAIVANITKNFLYETITENCQHYFIDWEKDNEFKMMSNPTLEAEVIYSGGGNAIVAYKSLETAKEINKRLSEKVLHETGVNLLISVIEKVEGVDFQKDLNQVFSCLREKKNECPPSIPLLGLSITELCTRTQRPVSNLDQTENGQKYIPYDLYSKQQAADRLKDEKSKYFDTSKYEMPLDLDDLGRGDGESHIAVVHIDGNSLGKIMQENLKKYNDYQESVAFMRTFSSFVAQTYRTTFQRMVEMLIIAVENNVLAKLKLKTKNSKILLPLRDIVLNGDDVTFVCDARIAIPLTEKFLKEIQSFCFPNSDKRLAACAGIAIVKPHFPFDRAYDLAEQCCTQAKKKAKSIHPDNPKSWLDFHIVQGGLSEDLHYTRKKYYTYFGKQLNKDYNAYHLLWRPWIVGEDDAETQRYNINHFDKIHTEFIKNWPRHRLKQFRNVLLQGENETELFINEVKSRGLTIPNVFFESVLMNDLLVYTSEYITPFLDVLEMVDLYIPIREEELATCTLK